jgi:hypothetical protein
MHVVARRWAFVFSSIAMAACGAKASPTPAPSAPTAAAAPVSQVSRYFPLVDGDQWAYAAKDDDSGNQGVFVTRARAMGGARYSLETGQRSRVLEVRPEGIARAETGTYLLRVPLTAGAVWPGDGGAQIRIANVDRVVDVPAGKFIGCIDTVEELRAASGEPLRCISTTYCPEVGIAELHAEAWENGRHAGERAVLRSFGKPISILKQ